MTFGPPLPPPLLERVQSSMAAAAIVDIDAGLMLCLRDGDVSCFNALLDRHRQSVVQSLFRIVQNQAIAEELAQEVFLRVYRARAKYEPSARFTTWLFRISNNLAFNWLRDERNQRLQKSLADDAAAGAIRGLCNDQPSMESVLVHRVKLNEVRDAIARLPPNQRAAVLMHKYDELEYSHIARVLKCSESAVKSLLFRAYESLRVRLAQYA